MRSKIPSKHIVEFKDTVAASGQSRNFPFINLSTVSYSPSSYCPDMKALFSMYITSNALTAGQSRASPEVRVIEGTKGEITAVQL